MAASDLEDRLVHLRHGLTVPVTAYVLLLDLEARGFTVQRDGRDVLVVEPATHLTDADCVAIRRAKWHILQLIDYCTRVDLDAHLFTDGPPAVAARTV